MRLFWISQKNMIPRIENVENMLPIFAEIYKNMSVKWPDSPVSLVAAFTTFSYLAYISYLDCLPRVFCHLNYRCCSRTQWGKSANKKKLKNCFKIVGFFCYLPLGITVLVNFILIIIYFFQYFSPIFYFCTIYAYAILLA